MTNIYVSSVGYTAVAQWAAGHVYAGGAIVRQLASPAAGSERCFRTSAGGTSHATTEPVWDLSKGSAQPTDNSITDWTEVTGNETYQSPGAWKAPYARLNTAMHGSYWASAVVANGGTGGTYLVGDVLTLNSDGNIYGTHSVWKVATVTGAQVATVTRVNGGSLLGTSGDQFSSGGSGGGGTGFSLTVTASAVSLSTDTFYVASSHAETLADAFTYSSQATTTNSQPMVLCVDESGTGHIPPTSADLRTTATVTITGNFSLHLSTLGYVYGIVFTGTSGANLQDLVAGFFSGICYLRNCALNRGSTAQSGLILSFNSQAKTVLDNTTISQGAINGSISVTGQAVWKNTPSALSGTIATTLISTIAGNLRISGVDLSALGSGHNLVSGSSASGTSLMFNDCKLGTSVAVASSVTSIGFNPVSLIRCDTSGTTNRHEQWGFEGSQIIETVVVRTLGAADRSIAISWNILSTANPAWWHPYESLPIAVDGSTLNTNVTVTVYGIRNAASLPNNDEIWPDVEYLGDATSPLTTTQSGSKSNFLATGSAWTADGTSAWDSLATARANTHLYSTGDVIKVATNAGRLFFCTSGGTSAGSEPGGYATAVDGGSVTDSGATFRAAVRFSMAVVLSAPQPQEVGDIYVTVKVAAASTRFYVDPVAYLS